MDQHVAEFIFTEEEKAMKKFNDAFINNPLDTLMTPEDVANILGVSVNTLNVWRCTKRYQLAYIKLGRCVRYRREDVQQFIAARTVHIGEQ